ncbi:MAG: hypothetical protein AAGA53_11130 [Pseudomonadota bacterium]
MTGYSPFSVSTSLIAMFVVSFCLVTLFAGILQQIGAPFIYISLLLLAFVVGLYLFTGLFGKTMRYSTFQGSDKQSKPIFTGLMIAAGVLSGGMYLLHAGIVYSQGTDYLVLFFGITLGLALCVVLFAASFARKTEATLASFLFPKGSSKLAVGMASVIVVICSFLLLATQISLIALFMENFYGITALNGTILVVFIATISLVMGGMQSLSIVRMMAYPVIGIAFFVPLIWVSYTFTGNPVPQLAFGEGALDSILEIDREMLNAGIATQQEIFNPVAEGQVYSGLNYFTTLVSIAFAFAATPHLLQHFTSLKKGREARRSGIWAMGFVLAVLTAIPAIAVFAKLDLYTSLLGLQLDDLQVEAPWIFDVSGRGNLPLITICGNFVSNVAEAVAACGKTGSYFLSLSDIRANPDYLMLSFAILSNLPQLLTVILVTGAVLAVCTTIDGLLLVMANTITTDVYNRIIRPKSPPGVKLFMNRFFLVSTAIVSVLIVHYLPLSTQQLFASTIALTAASLFPALLCRIWVSWVTNTQLAVCMAFSFLLTAVLLWLVLLGLDAVPNSGDEIAFGIPVLMNTVTDQSLGLIGFILFFITLILLKGWNHFRGGLQKRDVADATG